MSKSADITYARNTVDNIESKNYLLVNSCGIYVRNPESIYILRPEGRKDYQLIIVCDGETVVTHNGEKIKLLNGDMIIIPPNVRNEYRYSANINAIWLHFSGTVVESLLDEYNLNPFTKYTVSDTEHFLLYAQKIVKELLSKKVGYTDNCNALLLNILTLAKRRIDEGLNKSRSNNPIDLSPIVEDMQTNFSQNKSMEDYAKMCHLSVSRFTHIFTDEIGIPPHKYLFNIRMNQAKILLAETNTRIASIATSVGYENPFYFSRTFKNFVGISPKEYREKFSHQ